MAAPIMLGIGPENDGVHLSQLEGYFNNSPGGRTPLCRHITEVTQEIRAIEETLRSNGQKAVIVIATDGESSDGDLITAMKPLQHLPVWVVIRLCTDEDAVVNYWNDIDGQLELDIDVLDDFCAEATEVHENNKWLTYGLPLQRLREFGTTLKEIDLLDESRLTSEQIRSMVSIILGGNKENLDTLFICGGLSGPELGMKNNLEIPNKKKLEEFFKKNKILPTVSISYLN